MICTTQDNNWCYDQAPNASVLMVENTIVQFPPTKKLTYNDGCLSPVAGWDSWMAFELPSVKIQSRVIQEQVF